MTLSPQQLIDEDAKRIFPSALPTTWTVRQRLPDYRIDYLVEVFDGDEKKGIESTGLEFAVQLKGVKKPRIVKKTARFSVETAHLAYWMDKTRYPVFLIFVDVVTKKGWWIFIQKTVKDGLVKRGWRKQQTVTLEFPTTNTLDDIELLLDAVKQSVPYMSSLWPGAIVPAIQSERDRLEALDPRLRVDIRAENEKLHYSITSKGEDVTLKMTFQGKDREDFHSNVQIPLDRGDPILLTPSRMTASGSKLFEHSVKEAVSVQIQRLSKADVKIRAANGEYLIDSIKADLKAGMKNVAVDCDLADGLLTISFVSVPPEEVAGEASMSFHLSLERYYGKNILTLPYLDQLFRFLRAASNREPIVIEFWRDGNLLIAIPVRLPDSLTSKNLYELVEAIRRARDVSRWLKLAPNLPMNASDFEDEDIDILHRLMDTGESRRSDVQFQVSAVVTSQRDLHEGKELGTLAFPVIRKGFKVYDVETQLEIQIVLTEAIVVSITPHEVPGDWVLICEGAPGSDMVLRQPNHPKQLLIASKTATDHDT